MPHTTETTAATQPLPAVLKQLKQCLRKGCFFCIEHAQHKPFMQGRWTRWGKPDCFNGDLGKISSEIERCREQHKDRFIRLNIEDFSFYSRFTIVVHEPAADGAWTS